MADMARTQSETVKAPGGAFVLSFPNLHAPQPARGNQAGGKYNCCLILRDDQTELMSAIKRMVFEAATAQWGDKAKERLKLGAEGDKRGIKPPILDGNKNSYADRAGYGPGTKFIRATTTIQPSCVGRNPKIALTPEAIRDTFYPGCKVNVVIHAWTWHDAANGDGVSIGLDAIQFAGDGERIGGGGVDAGAAFDTIGDDTKAAAEGGKGAGAVFGDDDVPF